jgi:hypothetical protein
MSLAAFARKARRLALAGIAVLGSTTFQNGCTMSTDDLSYLLDSFESGYYYSDPYDSWDSGYGSWDNSYDSPLDWPLLDVKSG